MTTIGPFYIDNMFYGGYFIAKIGSVKSPPLWICGPEYTPDPNIRTIFMTAMWGLKREYEKVLFFLDKENKILGMYGKQGDGKLEKFSELTYTPCNTLADKDVADLSPGQKKVYEKHVTLSRKPRVYSRVLACKFTSKNQVILGCKF